MGNLCESTDADESRVHDCLKQLIIEAQKHSTVTSGHTHKNN